VVFDQHRWIAAFAEVNEMLNLNLFIRIVDLRIGQTHGPTLSCRAGVSLEKKMPADIRRRVFEFGYYCYFRT
jgi:hypothetical protein